MTFKISTCTFQKKYGDSESDGWSQRRIGVRLNTLPEMYMSAFFEKVVNKDTRWVDVGGGRISITHNTSLIRRAVHNGVRRIWLRP